MMALAEFEEKTYEIAYDVELSAEGGPTPWGPGQVLEHLVGFDAAANPDASHPIWRILNAPRPNGLVLLPDHWQGLPGRRPAKRALPSDPFSFIVQFKRPEFIRSHAGKQWKLWRIPYYRFKIDSGQQRTLKQLEANTVGDAFVRYASPAFVTNQSMDVARLSRRVIALSGHVSPAVLSGHSVWTYLGAGDVGRGNPTGRESRFDRLSDLFRNLHTNDESPALPASAELMAADPVRRHVETIAQAAVFRRPYLRRTVMAWRRELLREGISPSLATTVSDFAAIQTLASGLGASWWVFDRHAVHSASPGSAR